MLRKCSSVLFVAVMVLAACSGGKAFAQDDAARTVRRPTLDVGRALQPDLDGRDQILFLKTFELSEEQKLRVETIMLVYRETFLDGMSEVRAGLADASPLQGGLSEDQLEQRRLVRSKLEALVQALQEVQGDSSADAQTRRVEILKEIEDARLMLNDASQPRVDEAAIAAMQVQMATVLESWSSSRQAMYQHAITSLQGVLGDDLDERQWKQFLQAHRRGMLFPDGRLSGEAVDLIRLLDEFELDQATQASLDEAIQQYASAIDGALLQRQRALRDEATVGVLRGRDLNVVVREEMAARQAVQHMNQQWVAAFEQLLGDSIGLAFRQRYRSSSYPRLYRPTKTARVFGVVYQLADLDPDVREALMELQGKYERERGAYLSQAIQLIDKHEAGALAERRLKELGGSPSDEASVEAASAIEEGIGALREHDQSYVEQIRTFLTSEQRDQLPFFARRGPA